MDGLLLNQNNEILVNEFNNNQITYSNISTKLVLMDNHQHLDVLEFLFSKNANFLVIRDYTLLAFSTALKSVFKYGVNILLRGRVTN